jgi:uncharacterized membrane protein
VAPHWAIILLSVLAILWVPIHYQRIDDGTWLMVFFAGLNAMLLLPAAWLGIRGWFPKFRSVEVAS